MQEDEARAYAAAHGLKVGESLRDINVSGAKLDRPGLDHAIERIRAGKSAGIIIAHLDRLARTENARLVIAQRITDAGGQVRCVAGAPDDWTTPEGELQVGIQGVVAQYEYRKKSQRWEQEKLRALDGGIPINRAPLGYRKDAVGRLVIEHNEAEHVRAIFEMRARGEGPAAIADYLEGAGVRTSQGAQGWSKQAVYGVLENRTYLGEIRWSGQVKEGACEAIVEPALWHAAQHPNGHRPTPRRGGRRSCSRASCDARGAVTRCRARTQAAASGSTAAPRGTLEGAVRPRRGSRRARSRPRPSRRSGPRARGRRGAG